MTFLTHRAAALAFGLLLVACSNEAPKPEDTGPAGPFVWKTLDGEPTDIIAHRGASGLRPEHTLAGYELAIDQGADWIEPDLVMTKDGVLVCRHDRYLSDTTDVASHPEFADRKTRKSVLTTTGRTTKNEWWVEDFTLAELKTLRAVQPRAARSKEYDGRFEIPTFAEVIALAKARSTPERTVGIVPETKHPSFFKEHGLDMEGALLVALEGAGWTEKTSPVMIQSFEPQILQSLRTKTDVRLVQLVFVDNPALALVLGTSAPHANLGMEAYAAFVDAIGPQKELAVDVHGRSTGFIAEAHERGLAVYPWTFRDDEPARDGVPIDKELRRIFAEGADGIFADFPATALRVRESLH